MHESKQTVTRYSQRGPLHVLSEELGLICYLHGLFGFVQTIHVPGASSAGAICLLLCVRVIMYPILHSSNISGQCRKELPRWSSGRLKDHRHKISSVRRLATRTQMH